MRLQTMRLGIGLMALVLALGLARSATATTINFASLSQPGSGSRSLGTSLTFGGFDFTSTPGGFGDLGLDVWQDSSPNHPVGGSAATSLFEFTALATTTFKPTGGGTFELDGIDLTQYGVGQPGGNFAVTFVGTKSNLSTVTQTFVVPIDAATPVLHPFTFSGFTDLTSVSVQQGIFAGGTAFQFDNIVVNAGPQGPTPVPEPATLLLMGSGIAGAVIRRRAARHEQSV